MSQAIVPRAYLDFATLSVFWVPLTLEGEIDHSFGAALDAGPHQAMTDRFLRLIDAEQSEAVFRFSALTHELRHFHDLLLTSWGNESFLWHFRAVVANLVLQEEMRRRNVKRFSLPLEPFGNELDGPLVEARRAIAHRNAWHAEGAPVLEALAYQTQLIFCWKYMGEAASKAATEFVSPFRDGQMIVALNGLGELLGRDGEEWEKCLYCLFVDCLDTASSPQRRLGHVAKMLFQRKGNWDEAKDVLTLFLRGAIDCRVGRQLLSAIHLDVFRKDLEAEQRLDVATRQWLGGLLEEFIEHRDVLRELLQGEPLATPSFYGYLDHLYKPEKASETLPLPRFYLHYPASHCEVRWGEPGRAPEGLCDHDVFAPPPARIRRRLPDDGTTSDRATAIYTRPFPSPFMGKPLSPAWSRFAAEVAGCVMLTEGYHVSNPIHYYWRRKVMPSLGFEWADWL